MTGNIERNQERTNERRKGGKNEPKKATDAKTETQKKQKGRQNIQAWTETKGERNQKKRTRTRGGMKKYGKRYLNFLAKL